jgi:tetratricopeptide (TPR) repeat protein
MPRRTSPRVQLAALATLVITAPATAQRPTPEFTQQIVHVGNFRVASDNPGRNDPKLGREIGDAIRGRLGDLVNKREARVVGGYEYRTILINASMTPDDVFSDQDIRAQARELRADEIVSGTFTRLPGGNIRVDASLVLYRDARMRQPFEPVTARSADRAAEVLAPRIAAARSQLVHQRRCENSMRAGAGTQALQHARAGIAAYPAATLARVCLLGALRGMGASVTQVATEAEHLLAHDPGSPFALEAAAVSYDTLKRRADAATMWLRLQATDSANLELAERVISAMAEGGNARAAEPLIVRLVKEHPDNLRLLRQEWRIAYDVRNWGLLISAGEAIFAKDSAARADSTFHLRLATAYRNNGQTFKAIETVAQGVNRFPKDQRLYALYTQFVKEEADSVLPRGLMLHPTSAELLALNAKELRARGQVAQALEAARRAVELDSTIAQGRLLVAQAEMELGRPDSALLTLSRAAAAGEDKRAVARFALSKGNTLFRAANGTERRADFELAMRFLLLADSLETTPQTKFVLGAAALKVAQAALTDAPKISVKEESCAVSRLGQRTIGVARASLESGQDVAPETVRQFMDYLTEIAPYADKQIAAFCPPTG